MAGVMVDGFVHRPGGHCGSSAMRDVLRFYGHDLSEEMVFGLGSGIGFLYYEDLSRVPPVYIGGRIMHMENVLCENLGIELEVVSGLAPAEAWAAVREMIDENLPVVVHVDVYDLDYLGAKRHFSQHRIVIAGYDEEKGVAYVSDNDREELQELPLESLSRARSSVSMPQPADNAFYRLKVPGRLPPLETVIPKAVKIVIENNLGMQAENATFKHKGATVSLGLAGLEKFSSSLTNLLPDCDEKTIAVQCKNIYVTVEKGGTGYGGHFRRLYGRFLVESSKILGSRDLEEIGKQFISIGDDWTVFALICKENSGNGPSVLRELQPLANELHRREREAFTKLEAAIKPND
ncbi:MAG: BtrH N-terminal domain-containing protein [Actinobacteria bacterium]|nr:BtrH N-terminal domain-containing protein [Actinomycetota bacterium]